MSATTFPAAPLTTKFFRPPARPDIVQRPRLTKRLNESLQRRPEAVQNLLLQTSILNRLCGALCDAILIARPEDEDRNPRSTILDSRLMLEHLDHGNLFLISHRRPEDAGASALAAR